MMRGPEAAPGRNSRPTGGEFLGRACWVSLLCDYIGLRGLLSEEPSFGGTWGLCPDSALESLTRSFKRLFWMPHS